MKSNINIQPLKVVSKLPNAFGSTINKYNELESEQHYNDGWRDVVTPTKTEYQKLGNLYFDEDNDVVTYEVIDFTQEQIQAIELQKQQQPLTDEQNRYLQRIEDGKHEYASFSAKLRLAKLNGEILEVEHIEIEEKLIDVRNEVIAGQWITAKYKFENSKQHLVDQYPYNLLYDKIVEYVTNNY